MTAASGSAPARRRWIVIAAVGSAFLLLTSVVVTAPGSMAWLEHGVGVAAFETTHRSDLLRSLATMDAVLQGPDSYRVLLLAVVAALCVLRFWSSAVWVLTATVTSASLAPAFKLLVDRRRPVWDDPITVLTDPSFPSGHATAGWLFAIVIALLACDHLTSRTMRTAVTVAAVAAAVVVSADRILLGVHYPSDVLGGALLGAFVALGCRGVVLALASRRAGAALGRDGAGRG